ncbi:MAG TPA: hypothetical protein DCW39_06640, partial [Betaproteobacteria bacterium]|nr:hypothetical protein [Betaproteobacteria bacterium]
MKLIFYLVFALPLVVFAEPNKSAIHYEVSVGDSLKALKISVCFDHALPPILFANDGSSTFVNNIRSNTGRVLDIEVDRINIPAEESARCIFYDVLLQPRNRGEQRGGAETRLIEGRDMLTSIGDWLLRPR